MKLAFVLFIIFTFLIPIVSFASDYSTPEATIETCHDFSYNRDFKLFTECLTIEGKIRFFMFLLLSASLNNIEGINNIDNNKKLKDIEKVLDKYNFKGQLDTPEDFEKHLNTINATKFYRELFEYADIDEVWHMFHGLLSKNIISITINKKEAEVKFKLSGEKNDHDSYLLKLESGKWLLDLPIDTSPNKSLKSHGHSPMLGPR